MPDSIITENLAMHASEAYAPVGLPAPSREADPSALIGIARQSMLSIMPETSPTVAEKYLRDASFALFMARAAEGIRKSGSSDLTGYYNDAIRGGIGSGELNELISILGNLQKAVPGKDAVKAHANRTKAAFSLLNARRIGYGMPTGAAVG